MFHVTVQGDTLEEVSAALYAAADAMSGGAAPRVTAVVQDKPAATRSKPKPEAEADEPPAMIYDKDVQPHVAKLGTTHGKEAAREVLANFEDEDGNPCTKATQVPAEH